MSRTGLWRQALLLGLLSALGPLAIDLYLPAFPAVAEEFHASAAQVQLSLVSFFFALALGQIVYGSLSDIFGRKAPLLAGLALFVAALIGCSLASSVEALIAWRFVQGLGACAGNAIARAIVRDLHTGPDAASLLSSMLLVLGVSPVVAPVVGSLLLTLVSWRALFWIVAVIVAATALLTLYALPETLPPEQRKRHGLAATLGTYRCLLGDSRFMAMVALCGMVTGLIFTFLAGSPFVYTQVYGVTPTLFGFLLGINAIAQIVCAQFNRKLMKRIGAKRQTQWMSIVATCASLLLLLLTWAGQGTLLLTVLLCLAIFGAVGLLLTPSAVTAMDDQGEAAGAAAALLGTGQVLLGACMSALLSVLADGSAVPMAAVLACCALAACGLSRAAFRSRSG